jgi:hypothetical protein
MSRSRKVTDGLQKALLDEPSESGETLKYEIKLQIQTTKSIGVRITIEQEIEQGFFFAWSTERNEEKEMNGPAMVENKMGRRNEGIDEAIDLVFSKLNHQLNE